MTTNNPDPELFVNKSFTLRSGGSLRGDIEQRLSAVESRMHQLLNNPSIDNARRGPLQIADADTLPGNVRNTRVQWPIAPILTAPNITNAYDSTNGWPFIDLINVGAGGANNPSALVDFPGLVSVDLLPDFRCQVADPGTAGTISVGLSVDLAAGVAGNKQILFRSAAGGNWFAVTGNGVGETTTNLGVAPSTTPQLLRIRMPTSTQVEFFIDGDLKHREIATIPVLTGIEFLYVGVGASQGGGAAEFLVSQWLSLSTLILAA